MALKPVYFFTEQNAFALTTVQQSFGPISENQFNITTRFSVSADKKAFSICKGVVLVQPSVVSGKVNLILRPYNQPYPGLNIKYFIYRGLNRSDFFVGDLVKEIDASNTDFVNKIRDDFESFYSQGLHDDQGQPIVKPGFTTKFIGYDEDETIPLARLISDYFFKESQFVEAGGVFTEEENTSFELPMIDGGKWLGNFSGPDCGIDVVLDYGDYKQEFDTGEFVFNLNYARAIYSSIELLAAETAVEKKLKREQIFQFMDIAAFYGLFVKEGEVKVSDGAGGMVSITGVGIYTDLLGSFATKNNWYLYIQSDRTRSYNFYDRYVLAEDNSNNLKIGVAQDALNDAFYKELDWPLIITNANQTTGTTNKNHLFLKLITDNNVNAALYGQIGTIENAQQNNFCNADYLRLPLDAEGNYSNLTTTIHLSNPAVEGVMVAGLTLLLYQGVVYSYKSGTTTNENDEVVDVYATPNFFDDVFDLIKARPLLQLNADAEFSKMTSQKLNLINHYYDKKQQGVSAVQTLVVNDVIETGVDETPTLARVTYITETIDVKANAVSPVGSVTTDTKTNPSAGGTVSKSKTYSLPEPYYCDLQLFTDSTQTITGLLLKTFDGTTPTKIILGLTQTENNFIKAILDVTALKNPRLFLIDLFEDGNELLSPENIKYQKYKVALVGEKTDGTLELFYPTADVIVYSLDKNYHFSKGYSKDFSFIIQENFVNEIDTLNII